MVSPRVVGGCLIYRGRTIGFCCRGGRRTRSRDGVHPALRERQRLADEPSRGWSRPTGPRPSTPQNFIHPRDHPQHEARSTGVLEEVITRRILCNTRAPTPGVAYFLDDTGQAAGQTMLPPFHGRKESQFLTPFLLRRSLCTLPHLTHEIWNGADGNITRSWWIK